VVPADLLVMARYVDSRAVAPKLIKRELGLADAAQCGYWWMSAIDQGGCAETSRATTPRRAGPLRVDQVVALLCGQYALAPFARTAYQALNNATVPLLFSRYWANKGVRRR